MTPHPNSHRQASGPGPEQGALFGDPAPATTTRPTRAPATQDPDLIAAVVRLADDPGYRLVERSGRVYRVEPGEGRKGGVEPVPTHEADVVRQLIDARGLELGGNHSIRLDGEITGSRSILVTKDLRGRVTRWANLRPLNRRHRARTDGSPDPDTPSGNTSGRITVHPSENGRSAVTCGRWSGAVVRTRAGAPGRYAVHNHAGKLIGHASSRAAGARLLARHCGWAPGPIETTATSTTRTGGRS